MPSWHGWDVLCELFAVLVVRLAQTGVVPRSYLIRGLMGRGRMLSNDDGSLLQICINFIRKDCDTIAPAISEPPMVHVCPQPGGAHLCNTAQCTPRKPTGELDLSA